jgi:hypothetical protein
LDQEYSVVKKMAVGIVERAYVLAKIY